MFKSAHFSTNIHIHTVVIIIIISIDCLIILTFSMFKVYKAISSRSRKWQSYELHCVKYNIKLSNLHY